MKLFKYTLEQLKDAVEHSRSVREVLKKLGVSPCGGNYSTFHKAVKYYQISTEHFHGQGWNKEDYSELLDNARKVREIPLEDILKPDTFYKSSGLRIKLINQGFKEHKCEMCGLTEWVGKPISLELDHINGIKTDNRLENLRILCPNCHSQTDTYRGRNKKRS